MKKKVILLMGPTAIGKTQVAIDLVQKFPLEIISVDSAMIYQKMNIGTGKPSKEELEIAPHHLIDIIEPTNSYSAADFCKASTELIKQIHNNNKIPLLVGGTMMYFNALKKGIAPLPKADKNLRQQLLEEERILGLKHLHQKLQTLDPTAAQKINANDPQRIFRALEVCLLTGKPISTLQQKQISFLEDFDICQLALVPDDRSYLHQKIAQRFHNMLQKGFIDEVSELRKCKNLSLENASMRSVGYRQVWQYLEQAFSKEIMVDKAIAATRQLAKRQLTWLRQWQDLHTLTQNKSLEQFAQIFLNNDEHEKK